MPSSLEYWRARENAQRQLNITDELAYAKEIEKIHNRMIRDIQDKINAFYSRYADSEGITLAEAKKKVSAFDVEAFSDKAAKYVKDKDFSKRANEELKLYNATMKINRLELLKSEIGLDMAGSYDELEELFGEKLTERTLGEFKRQAGILGESVIRPEKLADSIVNASFHNATYSDRIWAHHDILRSDLDKILSEALIQGLHPSALKSRVMPNINDAIKNKSYAAMRLLTTELCRVQIDAQMKSYARNGYDAYRYIAEPTACPDCKALDDMTFKLDKLSIGENAPPLHPNCRCSTAAHFDDARDNLSRMEHNRDNNTLYQTIAKRKLCPSLNPGIGNIDIEKGYKQKNHKSEIKISKWILETFGGNIKLLKEKNQNNIKTPDYLWNNKLWELKDISTEKAADNAVREALKQIKENPGGIILNRTQEMNISELKDVINKRMTRNNKKRKADIIALKDGVIDFIWRY